MPGPFTCCQRARRRPPKGLWPLGGQWRSRRSHRERARIDIAQARRACAARATVAARWPCVQRSRAVAVAQPGAIQDDGSARPAPNAHPTQQPNERGARGEADAGQRPHGEREHERREPESQQDAVEPQASGSGIVQRQRSGTWRRICGAIFTPRQSAIAAASAIAAPSRLAHTAGVAPTRCPRAPGRRRSMRRRPRPQGERGAGHERRRAAGVAERAADRVHHREAARRPRPCDAGEQRGDRGAGRQPTQHGTIVS